MRSVLQLNIILVSCFMGIWTQAVGKEVLMNISMPERNGPVNYSSDPALTFVNVAGLSRLDFGLKGCSGAKIILLKDRQNFTDFLEIILSKVDNSGTQISECQNDSWCEVRNSSDMKPMYCYGSIAFWISFRSPMVSIGIPGLVLTSWTPPPFSNVELDLISYIGFSNEKQELSLQFSRDSGTNVCYVKEEEATSTQQCGDNFYDQVLCGQCGCCYHEHRQPPCFYSMTQKEVQSDRCLRSIKELSGVIVFLAQTPAYVNENVTFLILVGTLRPNFTYVIHFESNESEIIDDVFDLRPPIPHWAHGRLPTYFDSLLNLNDNENIAESQETDYFGVELSHVYNDTGRFVVNFSVSGQRTLRDDRDNFTVQALVDVQRRPTLAELINFTLLVSRSLAFSSEKMEFIYLIQNSFPGLSYSVDFGDGSQVEVFSSRRIEARNSSVLPGWLLTDNGLFSSINSTEAERDRKTPDFLSWPIHHHLLFDHVYLQPGNYVVSVNVSGYILVVNIHDQHITDLVIDVERRPRLSELVGGLVFAASSPAYHKEAVSFAVLVENNHPSLSAGVEFGDDSDCLLLHLSKSVVSPAWLSDEFLYKAYGMNDSEVEDFLNSTLIYVGHEFKHTYQANGTYNVMIVISGYQPVVLKSDNIQMTAEIKVKLRPTLSQAIGHSVLLVDSPVYVNENTTFLVGTEYFYPELVYTLNFGDLSSHVLFKLNQTQSLFDWSLHKYKRSDHSGILPGANVSGFRLETVKHVYKSTGSYSAVLYVTGILKVVRKCDTVFKGQKVDVQRRPTLSEILKNDVVMVARNRLYTNQDVNVFFRLPSNLSNLSYVVDCGEGSAAKAIVTKPFIKIPDWITNGSDFISNIPNPMQLKTFLLTTGSSFFTATTSCRYKTSNNYSIGLNISGLVESVGKVDFHRLFIPVSVISRPTLSMEIGRISLFIRKPVYVSEETNLIVAVENYFPKLQHSLSAEREARLSKGDLVFSQNVSFPDWLENRSYYSSGNFSNGIMPSDVYWTETNVTFLKSKAFDVTFNVSGRLETVDRWESVIRSIQIVAVELPKLSELLRDKCRVTNTSLLLVDKIIGFVFLCQKIDHQEYLNFRVDFGDNWSEETFLMSPQFLLPNWIRTNNESIFQTLVHAAQRNVTRSAELYNYNGGDFYHMYYTPGNRKLRVTVSADEGFRVKDNTEFVINHQVLIEQIPVPPSPPPPKCRPYSVSIRGGGISSDMPGKFGRNVPIRLEVVTHSDCLVAEEETFVWEMVEDDGHSKHSRVLDSPNKGKLTLDAYSLRYGKYKISVKVSIGNSSKSDLIMRDETWISIEPSPLHVELIGGPVVVTDYFRDVTITAVHYQDVDEHPNIRSSDPVFTWFCTGPNEELPQEPLNRKYQGSDGGGCFGRGLLVSNGTSRSLVFRSDQSIFRTLPAVFIVHVFISKPSRPPMSSQQAVLVLQKGPPSIRVVCISNCGEFLNVDARLVLNATCLNCTSVEKLEFLWELESTCHAVKESDWKRNISSQNTANRLIVDPGVFSASVGADLQYRLKVTVTRQEKSHASAVYIVQTRSQPQGNPPSKLSQDAVADNFVGIIQVSAGPRAATPSCPLLLLLLFLVFALCARSDGCF